MEFVMGQAIPARTDYCADQLRGPTRQTKDAAQTPSVPLFDPK